MSKQPKLGERVDTPEQRARRFIMEPGDGEFYGPGETIPPRPEFTEEQKAQLREQARLRRERGVA